MEEKDLENLEDKVGDVLLDNVEKIRPNAGWIRYILIFLLVLTIGIVGGYTGFRYYHKNIQTTTDNAAIYSWEGDYIDKNNFQTTMSIEEGKKEHQYRVTISMGEDSDSDLIFWEFTANYDDQSGTLTYNDGKRKDWIMVDKESEDGDAESIAAEVEANEANAEAEESRAEAGDDSVSVSNKKEEDLTTQEVYSDGTGHLEVKNGQITWVDNKEDFGNGLIFERVE